MWLPYPVSCISPEAVCQSSGWRSAIKQNVVDTAIIAAEKRGVILERPEHFCQRTWFLTTFRCRFDSL